ncbi:hypothetical protein [Cohnella boryungensis]|uniref:Glycosyl transferase n=1 Tax=Cohnella boryungensis TaxID=768479 RepID=A0ABV8SCA4_9BACL
MKKTVTRRIRKHFRAAGKQRRPPKRNRLVFVVLAHEREDILANQIRNIRYYNPESRIILYNSSGLAEFGRHLEEIEICPYQRGPLAWGRTGCVLYDAMRGLKESQADYDYLVYIDSDVLFLRSGFLSYLDETMSGYDVMGVNLHVEHGPGEWIPGQTMWEEWPSWQALFHTDYLAGMFANGQVYRKALVDRMYEGIDTERLESLFQTTQVIALEEILHATLAVRSGAAYRSFPETEAQYIRYKPPLSLADVQAAEQNERVYFVHPVLREAEDPARQWVDQLLETRARSAAKLVRERKKRRSSTSASKQLRPLRRRRAKSGGKSKRVIRARKK